ncbi:MAG: carbohydrate kinase family protein [Paludibacter sp.]
MIKISVTGCGLGDFVYNNIDFSSETFQKYISNQSGDGGLEPGKLVFTQELEAFAQQPFKKILSEIAGNCSFDAFNIGGPALVSAINAAQLLFNTNAAVNYYGVRANDEKGRAISTLLNKFTFNLDNYIVLDGETPYTDVLSDPNFADGKGERTFVNNIACAGQYNVDFLDDNFWNSNIVVFGGTALVPKLHTDLTQLLAKAKLKGALTVVNTVYDFPNQKQHPDKPWPLGNTLESLPLIDLLIMDHEEALRISGTNNLIDAIIYFKDNGSNAFIITQGADFTYLYSSGKLFATIETTLPVCHWITHEFADQPQLKGDTTGCGDNFVGAVITSIVQQLLTNTHFLSLKDAAILGTVSGGFTCYYVGGTFYEKYEGEKLEKINGMLKRYKELII